MRTKKQTREFKAWRKRTRLAHQRIRQAKNPRGFVGWRQSVIRKSRTLKEYDALKHTKFKDALRQAICHAK